ncbi:uncharacterized protein [Diadema antillarum]|uniref:uncharacterized protein n=1 Tax=Diadema antillarum TaxID=105358 RepID=UPI003A8B78FF
MSFHLDLSLIVLMLFGSLIQTKNGYAANILINAVYGEGSHFMAASAIGRSLVNRGHNVTFLVGKAYGHRAVDPRYSMFSFEIFNHTVSPDIAKRNFDRLNNIAFETWILGQFMKMIDLLLDQMVDDCGSIISDKALMERLASMDAIVTDYSWMCGMHIKDFPRPLPPNLIRVGGLTVTIAKPLDKTKNGYAANILINAVYGEGSHFMAASAIGRSLVNRGHNVTFLVGKAYGHRAVDPRPLPPNLIRVGGLTVTIAKPLDKTKNGYAANILINAV